MPITDHVLKSPLLRDLVGGVYLMGQRSYEARYQAQLRQTYEIDPTFQIGPETRMTGGGRIICGPRGYIGVRCNIQSVDGHLVRIGRGCALSHNIYIYTSNRVADQDLSREPPELHEGDVALGEHCWIGEGVIILEGVTVGENSVIGAHSVVNRDIPARSIAIGSPARVTRRKNQ